MKYRKTSQTNKFVRKKGNSDQYFKVLTNSPEYSIVKRVLEAVRLSQIAKKAKTNAIVAFTN